MANDSTDNPPIVTMRETITGTLVLGVRYAKTDIRVLSSTHPKKTANGSNGTSAKDNDEIIKSTYYLNKTYGYERLRWLVITFDDEASKEGLINLLKGFNELKNKAIPRYLNNCYQDSMKPWLCVYGLRERQSFSKGLPCYDLNILLLYLDELGKPLFDLNVLIKSIYGSASKSAKETIAAPLDIWKHCPDITKHELQLAYYLAKQVDEGSLKKLSDNINTDYILSQWATIPKSLKAQIKDKKCDLIGATLNDVKEEAETNECVDSVRSNGRKLIVRLKPETSGTFSEQLKQKYPADF